MKPSDIAIRSFLRSAAIATAAVPAAGLLGTEAAVAAPATPDIAKPAGPIDEDRWQRCLTVARMLTLVGPKNEDLKLTYLRTLIENGLPKPTTLKKILI